MNSPISEAAAAAAEVCESKSTLDYDKHFTIPQTRAFYRFKMASVAISGEICFFKGKTSAGGVRLQDRMKCGLKREYGGVQCFPLKSSDSGVDRAFPLRRKQICSYDPYDIQSPASDDTPDPSGRAG